MEAYTVAPIVSPGLSTVTLSMEKLRFQRVFVTPSEIYPSAICVPVPPAFMGYTGILFSPSEVVIVVVVGFVIVGSNPAVVPFPTSLTANTAVGITPSSMTSASNRLSRRFGVHLVCSFIHSFLLILCPHRAFGGRPCGRVGRLRRQSVAACCASLSSYLPFILMRRASRIAVLLVLFEVYIIEIWYDSLKFA